MKYNFIPLQDFLKDYHASSPTQEDLELLQDQIAKLLEVNEKESEEHQKNALNFFLTKSFNYECNTKKRIDLAICQEKEARVIFECKSLSNRFEFIQEKKGLDSKAFYESILYFLRETFLSKNNNLTFIILTNTRDFYLIDAKEYLIFAKHKAIKKAFENCEEKQGNDVSTKKFYEEIKGILQDFEHTLNYTHFELCANLSDSELSFIYQILSPKVLLKAISYIDANTLNQRFYDELLYILGLREVTQNSKVFIEPSQTPNTLLDALCQAYGLDSKKDFEIIFALLTTWNNRILFLRLLESMLKSFKHIQKEFLISETIKDFSTLQTLFFGVLAKKEDQRDPSISESLKSIPYLNSSLFDKTPLEQEGKEIKLLDSKPLALYEHSILHKDEIWKKHFNCTLGANHLSPPPS